MVSSFVVSQYGALGNCDGCTLHYVQVIYPPGELDFPSVTICNLNQFHMRRLLKYGLIDSMEVLNSDTFTQGNVIFIMKCIS